MNSHFSGLQNRDRVNESKKKIRREKLETRKASLTHSNHEKDNIESVFQTASNTALRKIKSDIRKKTKRQDYFYVAMFLFTIAILIHFAFKYKVF